MFKSALGLCTSILLLQSPVGPHAGVIGSSPSAPAPSYIAGSAAGLNQAIGNANLTVTMGASLSAGNTIVCATMDEAGINKTITMSDGNGNTYHLDRTQNLATDADTFDVFHADNISVSLQNPPQPKASGADIVLLGCLAMSGTPSSSFDKTNSQNATNTAFSSTSTSSLSQPNELVVGAFGVNLQVGGTPTITVGSGFTQLVSVNRISSSSPCLYIEYQIVSSSAGIAATATYSVSTEYAGIVATYK